MMGVCAARYVGHEVEAGTSVWLALLLGLATTGMQTVFALYIGSRGARLRYDRELLKLETQLTKVEELDLMLRQSIHQIGSGPNGEPCPLCKVAHLPVFPRNFTDLN